MPCNNVIAQAEWGQFSRLMKMSIAFIFCFPMSTSVYLTIRLFLFVFFLFSSSMSNLRSLYFFSFFFFPCTFVLPLVPSCPSSLFLGVFFLPCSVPRSPLYPCCYCHIIPLLWFHSSAWRKKTVLEKREGGKTNRNPRRVFCRGKAEGEESWGDTQAK